MNFKDKKVLVAGTGISGIGAANLLVSKGAKVVLYDGNKDIDQKELERKIEGGMTQVILGELTEPDVVGIDFMVISPGIPVDAPFTSVVREKGIPILSEIELAYEAGCGHVIGITGTNGKTTTTALVGKIMRDYYDSVFVVGNIGTPYTEVVNRLREDSVVVAEISSFQLETIIRFQPQISAILNITPDHLNRHGTVENYANVKLKIAMNQTKDQYCVLNYDDEATRAMAKKIEAVPVFFSRIHTLKEGVFLRGDTIILKRDGVETEVLKTGELRIIGRHNVENVMAAVAISAYYGIPVSSIAASAKEFTAVEHRIEFVETIHGVDYYNDSKGTNPDAAIKGIQAMTKPTYLIGGGYDKGTPFDDWIMSFEGKVRLLILLGATAKEIAATADRLGFHDYMFADTLEEAVAICAQKAQQGEAVLLSPACASWGMFTCYEQRGELFKEYVRNLKG